MIIHYKLSEIIKRGILPKLGHSFPKSSGMLMLRKNFNSKFIAKKAIFCPSTTNSKIIFANANINPFFIHFMLPLSLFSVSVLYHTFQKKSRGY